MLISLELSPNSFVPRQVYTPWIVAEVNANDVLVRSTVSGDSLMLYSSLNSSTVTSIESEKGGTTEHTNYKCSWLCRFNQEVYTWFLFPIHNLDPVHKGIIENTPPSARNIDWPTNLHSNSASVTNSDWWNSWRWKVLCSRYKCFLENKRNTIPLRNTSPLAWCVCAACTWYAASHLKNV